MFDPNFVTYYIFIFLDFMLYLNVTQLFGNAGIITQIQFSILCKSLLKDLFYMLSFKTENQLTHDNEVKFNEPSKQLRKSFYYS